MSLYLKYYCTSHTGMVRNNNQDNFFCMGRFMDSVNDGIKEILKGNVDFSDTPVFGVFDGMGGEECGEMAAYIAARNLSEANWYKPYSASLTEYCRNANAEICKFAENNGVRSMGTTAAVIFFKEKKAVFCNVGDSKIYHLSNEGLRQISVDHVMMVGNGRKPSLYQYLGIPETDAIITPYVSDMMCKEGDIFLLCSDGISDMVSDEDIGEILAVKTHMAEHILNKAIDNGGKDNITFIILEVCKRGFFDIFRNKMTEQGG